MSGVLKTLKEAAMSKLVYRLRQLHVCRQLPHAERGRGGRNTEGAQVGVVRTTRTHTTGGAVGLPHLTTKTVCLLEEGSSSSQIPVTFF